jgi:uncharacterized Zn ribbon protein
MAVGKRAGLIGTGILQWVRQLFSPLPVAAPPAAPITGQTGIRAPRPYDMRKQNLPRTFSAQDWNRALDYWGDKCAICERPRGLWHTLAQDHWIPLTHPDCPGTVPTNILPLCHGEDGCNNSKGKKDPEAWLVAKLGRRRANRKLREIADYFNWIYGQEPRRLGCPQCGAPVQQFSTQLGEMWQCTSCDATWDEALMRSMTNCPRCECWMIPHDHTSYACPRCQTVWSASEVPNAEVCPNCEQGILTWMESEGGWWLCPNCGAEWEDAD